MELPIGISDFKKLVTYRNPLTEEPYLYVDKTSFIREIVGDGSEVIIITRPRRFGKTINMSMLQYFYATEVDGERTAKLFENLNISKDPDVMKRQGSHPVLFVSFKGVDGDDFKSALAAICGIIRKVASQHRYLLTSEKLAEDEIKEFRKYLVQENTLTINNVNMSLQRITYFVEKHFNKKVIVLIDEYDAPIQKAYSKNYYDQIISLFRDMFGDLLKENSSLEKAVLTGILRVSKESLFSTLNNVEVYSVLHSKYSEYFGFTEPEVKQLLETKNISSLDKAREWYNGYKFGDSTVYNPWSIIKFIKENGKLKSHWVNTSSNRLAEDLLLQASPIIKEKIETLMTGDSVVALVDEHVVFKDLDRDESALWSLLLSSGYLMSIKETPEDQYYRCELKVPNREVMGFYLSTVKKWISSAGGITWFEDFVAALMSGKAQSIEKKIQDVIDNTMSYHDTAKNVYEAFFHGLMLGVVVGLKDDYKIKSNRESGLGRYDVALFPKDKSRPGMIMEFKAENTIKDKAEALARQAIKQLTALNYEQELKDAGITKVISLGIGFTKNKVKVIDATTN